MSADVDLFLAEAQELWHTQHVEPALLPASADAMVDDGKRRRHRPLPAEPPASLKEERTARGTFRFLCRNFHRDRGSSGSARPGALTRGRSSRPRVSAATPSASL